MHPPFYVIDHKVGRDAVHISVPRRAARARLDLSVATVNWPPVPLALPPAPPLGAHLFVVPAPSGRWRDVLGRWLIRQGQRMILTNHPG